MGWDELPSILLEDIFSLVSITQRYYCSQVCRSWNEIFYSSVVWYTFVFDGVTFTRKKFNLFRGYERILNAYRVQRYLSRKSQCMRRLIIQPIPEYHNMCDFLNVLSSFIHYHRQDYYPFPHLEEFSFTFHVLVSIEDDTNNQGGIINAYYQHSNAIIRGKKRYYGTGGNILETLRRFVSSIRCLKRFYLNNLLLESNSDIGSCLDELLENSCETLEHLEILNYTSHIIPLYTVGLFSNLCSLSISSHSLSDDVLLLFANHLANLHRLNIIQDELTIPCRYSDSVWIEIDLILRENKRQWCIRMVTKGKCKTEPFWPSSPAPVRAIVYDTHSVRAVQSSIYTCMEQYSKTLEIYAHLKSMCRVYIPRSFVERADTAYISLVKTVRYLNTLAIRERISTATCLLLAYYGTKHNLKHFYLRRNCVILRNEYRKYVFNERDDNNEQIHSWLEKNCRKYDHVEDAISILFGRPWKMLTDWEYNHIHV
ncbi:unnamed protein product [Rotaria magnacalcarata]|uniref:F-box domain-containing protein n=7 Tax=Rotaria magnacalcarata TaxID=392030 RepID=A0A816B702_9BILA|nr:unnamed protein product [Rotaria magnacalcarata]CAF1651246.1 unnamed protein product [Rotaria magnacalcarata]CAF1919188.1 unnamed protein product [Rotaria magnacalcarata]CAF3841405.1 unnamed protein product [Rotaria magnacalcarata]CAF4044650.1 unnamed protein product [Rotaria magnacalcarata]